MIPSEAVGSIIGKKGTVIKQMRLTDGITQCSFQRAEGLLNRCFLELAGSAAAIDAVFNQVVGIIKRARTNMKNRSRADHSWRLTTNGYFLTPRIVHHTGQRAPKCMHATEVNNHYVAKKTSKRAKDERNRAIELLRGRATEVNDRYAAKKKKMAKRATERKMAIELLGVQDRRHRA
ncbi:TPA: hypothetical protein N0F65_007015 [Lagenidium giganteum]|uniref:K Homology domain-containing protein n=1 Tax=Lagenidium giganteum TaxID=4803 RepID=A0AAV2ZKS4_9STRA|nr:TPA: hypothetical protein N0F65_007015 [Lagenidium giganteum]